MNTLRRLPRPRAGDKPLRKVCGQYHRPDGVTILHLTCGHHLEASGPRPAETWVLCAECFPAPDRGGGRA